MTHPASPESPTHSPLDYSPAGRAIKHCRNCGAATVMRLPDDGDTKERAVCPACHTVHYVNPLNVVGMVAEWEGKILLCKRNIEPRWGKWTLPAGFMELDETTSDGARRETLEEAGACVGDAMLFSIISVVHVGQVHIFYHAPLLSPHFNPGHESLEARLFAENEIPWDELAFRTVRETLQRYLADRRSGIHGIHEWAI
jgi:ADP-ribose pyrophosphatase YjhB (NUDIX family)